MLKSEQLRRLHLLQMAVLRLLCKPEKKSVIDKILMGELSKARQCGHMEHDAMGGEHTVLFGYICDMPRIRRFNIELRANGRKGILYCFNFQEEAVRHICGPNMDIQCMDF